MRRFNLIRLSSVLLLWVTSFSLAYGDAENFADSLKAGEETGLLTIDAAYAREASGLRRVSSPCGSSNCDTSGNRPMNETIPGADFINRDFIASLEITRTAPGTDLIWFGFGDGSTEGIFSEPNNAIQFRIHAGGLAGSRIDLTSILNGSFTNIVDGDGVTFPGSTTEFIIERQGDNVTISIPALGTSKTLTISGDLGGVLNASNSRLFFGNTSVGTVFSNFRVSSAPIGDPVPPLSDPAPNINWAQWQSMTPGPETSGQYVDTSVFGTITTPTATVNVTYNNPQGVAGPWSGLPGVQLNDTGIDY